MFKRPAIIVAEDAHRLAQKGADLFVRTTRECVSNRGRCVVALSGGSTPRAMHRLLAQEPWQLDVPWRNMHLCWVDDRMVPYYHPASNFGAAKQDFLDQVAIPSEHIHPMPVDIAPEEAAFRYQRQLQILFNGQNNSLPCFDLIFLGIGRDGHTASLFPGQSALDENERWVVAVKGGDPDVYRSTLTLPVLNRGRTVVFLASGKTKALVVKEILENRQAGLPAQRVLPMDGQVIWLLDQDAAALLSSEIIHD